MHSPKIRDVLDKEAKYTCENVACIEHDGMPVALQKWTLTANSKVDWDEIDAHKIDHENLLKYHDIELVEKKETSGFCSRRLYFLTEYGKNMAYYYPNPSWDMVYRFARQIATGLNFLHANGVAHGNLTAKNVFITDDFTAKLGGHLYPKNNVANMPTADRMLKDIFDYGKVLCEMILCCDFTDDLYDNFETLPKMARCPKSIIEVIVSCRKPPHERPTLLYILELLATEKFEYVGDVVLGDMIAKNDLAKVYKGSLNGKTVVAKQFNVQRFRKTNIREFDTCYALDHPNIVKCHGTFFSHEQCQLIMEYLPHNLRTFYETHTPTWKNIYDIGKDIITGLNYIHAKGMWHDNLKDNSVLVTEDGNAKLSHVGLIKVRINMVDQGAKYQGSLRWRAPESYARRAPTDLWNMQRQNIYTFGLLLWQLASRKVPYAELIDPTDIIKANSNNYVHPIDASWPEYFKTLLGSCLNTNPALRPSCDDILEIYSKNTL